MVPKLVKAMGCKEVSGHHNRSSSSPEYLGRVRLTTHSNSIKAPPKDLDSPTTFQRMATQAVKVLYRANKVKVMDRISTIST